MDWNVDSGDSKRKNVPASEIVAHATDVPAGTSSVVVLMHDGGAHAETVKALPDIIRFYKQHGYRFEVMKASDKPVQFQVKPAVKYKHRQSPTPNWIAKHVNSNADQWTTAKPLKIELGYMTVELKPDEYRLKDQTIMVPLRSYMSKLGGNISWDQSSRYCKHMVERSNCSSQPGEGYIDVKRLHDQGGLTVQAVMESREGTIWVSAGDLMEQLGAKQYTVQPKDREWVITVEPPWTSMEHGHFIA